MEISATDFKAKCLSLMDFVQEKREEVIITKHGKSVAKLVPINDEKKIVSPVGFLQGKLTIKEDIVKTIDVKWFEPSIFNLKLLQSPLICPEIFILIPQID